MDTTPSAAEPTESEVSPQATEAARGGRFWRFPLTWMIVGLAAVAVASLLTPLWVPVFPILSAILAVVAYRLVMRYVARRPVPELTRTGSVRQALSGGGVGLGFLLVSVLSIAVFGGYTFTWVSDNVVWTFVSLASVSLAAAVTEELMFRGIALQALEQMLGSAWAVTITAAFFGLAHLGNPGATLWSSMAIAIEAGVLLGAAYLWTRNIWFVAGLHFAWNTAQSMFGIPGSGHDVDGFVTAEPHGPALFSGGEFGLEASIVPVIVSLTIAIPMFIRAKRAGQLVPMRRSRR